MHSKCSEVTVSEQKYLTLKNRILKYFCPLCEKDLRDIPELKQLIAQLLLEVN